MPDNAPNEAPNEQKTALVSNALGVIGFIILIVILIWGLFNLASMSKPWFASLFPSRVRTIVITAPKENVQSGAPVTISWKYEPSAAGSYAFLYQCRSGFQFKLAGTDNAIPCGTSFITASNASNTTNSLLVIPTLSIAPAGDSLTVPFSILYTRTAAAGTTGVREAQGSASIAIIKRTASQSPTVTTPPEKTPGRGGAAGGTPNLTVRILSYGVIDSISGNILPRRPSSPADLVAVTFDIANAGGAPTGAWQFTAQLPVTPAFTYRSPPQASLAPGDHIENMLRFTQISAAGGAFSVTVDPGNAVRESNESDNTATTSI